MKTENNVIDILKSVGIVLLLPAIFFLFMGPMKLAEIYPDHQWLRYFPFTLLLVPVLFFAFQKRSNDNGGVS